MLDLVAFDADDTLWRCEHLFQDAQARFRALLADHADPEGLEARTLAAERRNLSRYGFGVKAFTLSLVETALEVTENRVPGAVLAEVLEMGRAMLAAPVELLPGAEDTLRALHGTVPLAIVTKGDLLDQERKVAASGLAPLVDAVEIVSSKTPETYARLFARHGVAPPRAMMVGNSMRSDVRPPVEIGAWGVHVPSEVEWVLERAPDPPSERFARIPHISALPHLVGAIMSKTLK